MNLIPGVSIDDSTSFTKKEMVKDFAELKAEINGLYKALNLADSDRIAVFDEDACEDEYKLLSLHLGLVATEDDFPTEDDEQLKLMGWTQIPDPGEKFPSVMYHKDGAVYAFAADEWFPSAFYIVEKTYK